LTDVDSDPDDHVVTVRVDHVVTTITELCEESEDADQGESGDAVAEAPDPSPLQELKLVRLKEEPRVVDWPPSACDVKMGGNLTVLLCSEENVMSGLAELVDELRQVVVVDHDDRSTIEDGTIVTVLSGDSGGPSANAWLASGNVLMFLLCVRSRGFVQTRDEK